MAHTTLDTEEMKLLAWFGGDRARQRAESEASKVDGIVKRLDKIEPYLLADTPLDARYCDATGSRYSLGVLKRYST